MNLLEQFFTISLLVQLVHVAEEIVTGFHRKWYLFRMPLWTFLFFELVFESFWITVFLFHNFPARPFLQAFFLILMFANGIQHVVWSGVVKEYVPGLLTAPIHIAVFLLFYFQSLF